MFLELFKEKNYRCYALGQGISHIGTLMTKTGIALYILAITNSAVEFSSVLAIAFLPQIFLYPFAGALVDRWDRRKTLIFSDLIRAFFLLAVAFFHFFIQPISLGMIYVFVIFNAVCDTFFFPATNSIIPFIFKEKDYVAGNSLNSWIINLASVLGPFIGVVLFSWKGIGAVILLDFLSFLTGAFYSYRLNLKKSIKTVRRNIFSDIHEGLQLFKDTDISLATCGVAFSRLLINPIDTIVLPFVLISILKAPKVSLAIMETAGVVGVLSSPILILILKKRFTTLKSLKISRGWKVVSYSLFAICAYLLMMNYNSQYIYTILIALFFLFVFLGHLFNSSGFAFLNTFYQSRVSRTMLGRFAASRSILYTIVQPLGIAFYGYLLDNISHLYIIGFAALGALLETATLLKIGKKSSLSF